MRFTNRSARWTRACATFTLSTLVCLGLAPEPSRAGAGRIDDDGNLHLNFHFRFPPLQTDIDRAQEQFQRASELMCDATEGEMKIASVRFSAGGMDEPAADVWYYPPGPITRSIANMGPLDAPGNRIYLAHDSIRSDVLFHEMGHLVFGLDDQYDEQRRKGTACGIGPAFDPDGLLDEQNHTIMQQAGFQQCVTPGGEPTGDPCYDDADCDGADTCPLPDLSSEFSVDTNHDPLRGNESTAPDTCPAPRAGNAYELIGFMGENTANVAFDPTDWTTARDTSEIEAVKEYIDELGIVPGYDQGSAHPIWVFPERVGPHAWILHFGLDEKHLDDGPHLPDGTADEGELFVFDSVDVEFEASPSISVPDGDGGNYQHGAVIRADGVLLSDPGYTPPVITIPDIAGMAGPRDLTLDLDGLEERFNWMGGRLGSSRITYSGYQQLGVCGELLGCDHRWNSTTQRWEASSATSEALLAGLTPSSDWERLVANVGAFYGLDWTTVAPAGLPQAAPHAGCDDEVVFDIDVVGIDQVYVVIDRSHSMSKIRNWTGENRTRMDWAKAGARGFAKLMEDEDVEVGLISFSLDVQEELPLAPIVEDGTAMAGEHELTTVYDAIDDLAPTYNTAIGDALYVAGQGLFAADPAGRGQAVMLLSDGGENGGALDPITVAEDLRDQNIPVYTVPIGDDSDGNFFGRISTTTGGAVLPAGEPDELPHLYASTWGQLRGEDAIWDGVRSETEIVSGTFSTTSHVIFVEEGSSRLNLMISGRGSEAWSPACQLTSPSGAITRSCDNPADVISDEFFRLFREPNPEPGFWTLTISGYSQPIQRSYLWAHSENPGPDCSAGVDHPFLDGEPAEGVRIHATASSDHPLGRGVLYNVEVETPNGTRLAIETMTLNARENGAEYVFDAFEGRGHYDVIVTCVATGASSFALGERPELEELLDEGDPIGFVRQARTSFFLDTNDYPPIPPGSVDCDANGTPDTAEIDPFGDDDQDGVQNVCDPDDDGDDVPDEEDLCPGEAETYGQFTEGRDPIDGCAVPEPAFGFGVAAGALALAFSRRADRRSCRATDSRTRGVRSSPDRSRGASSCA